MTRQEPNIEREFLKPARYNLYSSKYESVYIYIQTLIDLQRETMFNTET